MVKEAEMCLQTRLSAWAEHACKQDVLPGSLHTISKVNVQLAYMPSLKKRKRLEFWAGFAVNTMWSLSLFVPPVPEMCLVFCPYLVEECIA